MPRFRPVLLALTAAAALAPTAAHAATTLSTEPASTLVAAWDDTVVWSQRGDDGRFRLVKSIDAGAPAPIGVGPREGAFDVDLGTNRNGSTYAVYTRDGDLYRMRLATGEETELDGLSSSSLPERGPSIFSGDIVFIRRDHGYDQIRIGNTTSGSAGTRFIVKKRSIAGVEYNGTQIAYVEVDGNKQRVHVRNVSSGNDDVVYTASSGGANAANVTRPTYGGDHNGFVWARTNIGSQTGNRIVRYQLRESKLGYAQGSSRYNSTAWAGGDLGAATASSLDARLGGNNCTDAGKDYCFVTVTGPLSFTLSP